MPATAVREKTSAPKVTSAIAPVSDVLTRRLFTVDEYHLMIEAGVFGDEDRVELLDGEIMMMSPIGPRHSGHVNRVNDYFVHFVSGKAIVHTQNPFIADKRSEPQPDILVLKWRDDWYSTAHPTPSDVLLLVEVSESSLIRDRAKKLAIYARNGILEYWILNLLEGTVEVYRRPDGNTYEWKKILTRNHSIAPLSFPAKKVAMKDLLLPPPKK